MSNHYRVLVIVPAYNEAESICATVKAVIDSGYDYVVVNDGSTDNTLEICHANHLNVLDLPQNLGIGGAVQAGHKYAKKYGYNIDVQVDGDGQHEGHLSIGWRFYISRREKCRKRKQGDK